jgi:hypothetical protein
MSQKLRRDIGVRELTPLDVASEAQHGSAAQAECSMERFCPIYSVAPVVAIVWVVAGIVLKRRMARPRWRD